MQHMAGKNHIVFIAPLIERFHEALQKQLLAELDKVLLNLGHGTALRLIVDLCQMRD